MSFGANKPGTTPTSAVANDIQVVQPPNDSISRISFCPTADILAVSSWNNEVRLYDVGPAGETRPRAMYAHDGPVLDLCWSKDGSRLFSAGADHAVKAFDMSTGQNTQVAGHEGPVSAVRWIDTPTGGLLATASWDKTLKYWDLKSPSPIASVSLPERCYAMDVSYPLLVIGTAERHILLINLSEPTKIFKTMPSPLKWTTRRVACFPKANGFVVTSIEGRVAVQYLDAADVQRNFSFRCHRKDEPAPARNSQLVFSVNDLVFHPKHGSLLSCGSDGVMSTWDLDSKTRLKNLDNLGGSVTSASFNPGGTILAYAVSYDWSKGYTGMTSDYPNRVQLHPVNDEEVMKRRRS